jgi:hypothetical protein
MSSKSQQNSWHPYREHRLLRPLIAACHVYTSNNKQQSHHRDNFIKLCVLSSSIAAPGASNLPATAPQRLADTAPQHVFKFACADDKLQGSFIYFSLPETLWPANLEIAMSLHGFEIVVQI